jgi:hypothetical protein
MLTPMPEIYEASSTFKFEVSSVELPCKLEIGDHRTVVLATCVRMVQCACL